MDDKLVNHLDNLVLRSLSKRNAKNSNTRLTYGVVGCGYFPSYPWICVLWSIYFQKLSITNTNPGVEYSCAMIVIYFHFGLIVDIHYEVTKKKYKITNQQHVIVIVLSFVSRSIFIKS